jgi:hypothetical protein
MCSSVKHNFTSGGECKRLSLMTPKCTPTLGITFMQESQMFKALVERENKRQMGLGYHWNFLKCKCLKCFHIIHLDVKCMSYDQKKG